MNIGVREWLDENSKAEYPLSKNIGITSFIVDAAFQQFDGFVPVLKSVKVTDSTMELTIKFDLLEKVITIIASDYVYGLTKKIYAGTRYLGSIAFGDGFLTMMSSFTNTTKVFNVAFASNVVAAIPTTAGVYSIQNLSGDVVIEGAAVKHIFFGVTGNDVIWNAVGLPDPLDFQPIKTLNGISPINNSVSLADSEVIKIDPSFNGLLISLASAGLTDKIAPVKKYA